MLCCRFSRVLNLTLLPFNLSICTFPASSVAALIMEKSNTGDIMLKTKGNKAVFYVESFLLLKRTAAKIVCLIFILRVMVFWTQT